jgi:hypothetical protein
VPPTLSIPPRYALLKNLSIDESEKYSAVHTGVKSMANLGKFTQWAGNTASLNVWKGCDKDNNR